MDKLKQFDVVIIGGSYAGMSAGLALGRSRRNVLIIDNNKPCNRQTPHSHNLLTHDGDRPADIRTKAREEVLRYSTVEIIDSTVRSVTGSDGHFTVSTGDELIFSAKKILFATGVKDTAMDIPGFAECWGISVLHCPYCHGYEVIDQSLGVIANGEMGFDYCRMISNWSNDLTLFTNGPSTLTAEQTNKLGIHGIRIIESNIRKIIHQSGKMQHLETEDGTLYKLDAVFAKPAVSMHASLETSLGCELHTEMFIGLLKIDQFGKTTVPGVYAAGDNSNPMRSLAASIAAGNISGAMMNRELIAESF